MSNTGDDGDERRGTTEKKRRVVVQDEEQTRDREHQLQRRSSVFGHVVGAPKYGHARERGILAYHAGRSSRQRRAWPLDRPLGVGTERRLRVRGRLRRGRLRCTLQWSRFSRRRCHANTAPSPPRSTAASLGDAVTSMAMRPLLRMHYARLCHAR